MYILMGHTTGLMLRLLVLAVVATMARVSDEALGGPLYEFCSNR